MSTEQSTPLRPDKATTPPPAAKKRRWGGWIAGAALAAFALFFIANCRTALDPRVANPNVVGRPRPVKFIFGLDYITSWMLPPPSHFLCCSACSSGAGGAIRAAR